MNNQRGRVLKTANLAQAEQALYFTLSVAEGATEKYEKSSTL
jgi:hypothetical protein